VEAGLVLELIVSTLEFSQFIAVLPWWIFGSRTKGVR
jgi:hypothetical protein